MSDFNDAIMRAIQMGVIKPEDFREQPNSPPPEIEFELDAAELLGPNGGISLGKLLETLKHNGVILDSSSIDELRGNLDP